MSITCSVYNFFFILPLNSHAHIKLFAIPLPCLLKCLYNFCFVFWNVYIIVFLPFSMFSVHSSFGSCIFFTEPWKFFKFLDFKFDTILNADKSASTSIFVKCRTYWHCHSSVAAFALLLVLFFFLVLVSKVSPMSKKGQEYLLITTALVFSFFKFQLQSLICSMFLIPQRNFLLIFCFISFCSLASVFEIPWHLLPSFLFRASWWFPG